MEERSPEERAKLLYQYKGNNDDEGGWIELGDRHPDFAYYTLLSHFIRQILRFTK